MESAQIRFNFVQDETLYHIRNIKEAKMVDKFVVSTHYRILFTSNLMRDKSQLLLPSKSCGCGIARTKVIAVFVVVVLSLSYLTFPHFELL